MVMQVRGVEMSGGSDPPKHLHDCHLGQLQDADQGGGLVDSPASCSSVVCVAHTALGC